VSAYNPGMSDSLISAGRLMEAGYNVNFRIPDDALKDGFTVALTFYECIITTPDNLTVIVMEYAGHTYEHIELPAKLLDNFQRSNRSNIDQRRLPEVRTISKSVTVTVTTLPPED